MGLKQLWYAQDFDTVLDQLGVDGQQGLSSKEAGERLHRFGPNKLKEQPGPSPVEIFLSQFKDFMVIVLIGATLISAMLGEYADAITILAIVFLNAILGFVQEFRAEKSMEALKKLTAPEATVVRSGREERVSADQLVPGDIILLETGDKIPADLRLGSTINLEIEESTLTGESVPVKKNQKTLPENTGLGDRRDRKSVV